MGYTPPVLQKLGFDKTGSGSSGSDPFIVDGTYGVATVRWETAGGYVYDMTVNDAGAVVTTLVSSPGATSYYASLWGLFANIE